MLHDWVVAGECKLSAFPSFRHECQDSNLQGNACKLVADADPLCAEVYS